MIEAVEGRCYAAVAVAIQPPRIPATAVVLRVVSILGMGLSFSAAVLLSVAAEWIWAITAAVSFVPFLGMMYVVDRMIPDPESYRAATPSPRDGET